MKGLQQCLNELELYCHEWKLNVNFDKTNVVVFKKGNKLSKNEKWFLNGQGLNVVPSYKYLGITLTSNLLWNKHTCNSSTQAKKLLIGTFRSLGCLHDLSYNTFFKIFDCKIAPVLLYGSEIWGFQDFSAIESVHLYACKRFLGVKRSTSNVIVYGECGRTPMYIVQYVWIMTYWLE